MAGFRTAMMVDYLCRQGIVVPSLRPAPGRGRPRLYGFGDLVLLRAVERILSAGVSVSRLRTALGKARRQFAKLGPERGLPRYLMTDGSRILLADDPGAVIELTAGDGRSFAVVIDVERARQDIVSAITRGLAP